MLGTLSKKVEESSLPCERCKYFCNDDPDIYYCEINKKEFPSLCKDYQFRMNKDDKD